MVAALVGAGIWAAITVTTNFQIGWMAVGVGFIVGYAVRILGKGVTKSFGIAGAALALLGCLMGNLMSACGYLAIERSATFWSVFSAALIHPVLAFELLKVTFSPMDLLFYGIAVYEGYKFSFRPITPEELAAVAKKE